NESFSILIPAVKRLILNRARYHADLENSALISQNEMATSAFEG
ncbi:MAG: hypothetical protein JWM11_7157, partial [Planctomycetaceae bacterium]|nr:hypothetical protein [Planctomycetaceae bacterium]